MSLKPPQTYVINNRDFLDHLNCRSLRTGVTNGQRPFVAVDFSGHVAGVRGGDSAAVFLFLQCFSGAGMEGGLPVGLGGLFSSR